jgi:hypothetical protein
MQTAAGDRGPPPPSPPTTRVSVEGDELFFACPNCAGWCIVHRDDVQCAVFRHLAVNGEPVPPHSSLEDCRRLARLPGAQGCGAALVLEPATGRVRLAAHDT